MDLATIRLAVWSFSFVASIFLNQDKSPQLPPHPRMMSIYLISVTVWRIECFLCSDRVSLWIQAVPLGGWRGAGPGPMFPTVWGYIGTTIGARSKGIRALCGCKMFWGLPSLISLFPRPPGRLGIIRRLLLSVHTTDPWGSQACLTRAIHTTLDVWQYPGLRSPQ